MGRLEWSSAECGSAFFYISFTTAVERGSEIELHAAKMYHNRPGWLASAVVAVGGSSFVRALLLPLAAALPASAPVASASVASATAAALDRLVTAAVEA